MRGHIGGGEGGHGGGGEGGATAAWTTAATGTATYAGSSGQDWVYLGGSGSTITVSAAERLQGGAGTDVVTLDGAGSTICVANIETLTGGAGTDVVVIAGGGATLSVSGVETLIGGGDDAVTVTSGTIRYEVRGDSAALTLAAGNGADQVVLADGGFGGRRGAGGFANTSDYNQIENFQSGTDQLVLSGRLKGKLDDDGDSIVDSAAAATSGIDVSTTEAALLTTVVAGLTDADFSSVRSAIGTLVNAGAGAEVLVLASDGTDSGAYLVTDVNGDGAVAATEIKLLGLFKNTASLALSDIAFG